MSEEEFLRELPVANILFVDCSLPQFSCEAALALWTEHGKPQPFIVLSGSIPKAKAILLQTLGATDFVLKDNWTELGVVTARALKDFETKHQVAIQQVDREVLHKVRNSLLVISGQADCMLMDGEFDREGCEAISASVGRINQVLNKLEGNNG
jgi:DNA-binding NtrC family response regulator